MVVGISNFLVSYVTFLALIALTPKATWSAGMAQAVSYSAGIVWSYYWNSRWTFRVDSQQGGAFFRFVLWQVALMILSSFSVAAWVGESSVAPGTVWVLVMGPVTVLNFVGTRQFVFRRPV